ncbi:MAG TPA: hypothetical protein VHC22_19015 [Pirellulales bacterium]|nr:hypothetical protein [Pirellulales bacterium]
MPIPARLRTRRNKRNSLPAPSRRDQLRSKWQASWERLEERLVFANFTAGNIAVLDLAAASNNTTGSILELSPSTANQANSVQTIGISASGANAMRFSDSGTSGFLSDSNDRTLLTFAAYNTTDSTDSDLATVTALDPASDRAVGTLDTDSDFTLQTTYTGTSTNQARSATSLNDSNFFITDKGGLYTNGATSASLTTNILDARSFGGTVYVSSTKTPAGVSTVSSPTATILSGLPGVPTDGSIQDFYLIQSGQHGSSYDILYTLDQNTTKSGAATINKYSLVSGNWVSNGSFSLAGNATAMIAANDGGNGAFLYVVTTAQLADNSLVRLTDTAGYNTAVSINTSNNVTLYTATGTSTLKGLDFVPAVSTVPTAASPTSANIGIGSATLGGTVTATGSQPVTGYGVVYSLTSVNGTPTIGGPGVTQVAGSGTAVFSPFTVNAMGLQGTSQYSFAAYATSAAGTSYSNVSTFTTQSANPPSIDTPTVNGVASNSATLGGTVESDGGATVTKSGVVYALTSVNSNPQIGGTGVTEIDTASPVDSGAFTVSANGLSAGAGYTFEAFATNSSGTTYTTATSFTTLAPPKINSPTVAAVTGNSATLGANVASDDGSAITKRGVVYALTSVNGNPQIGGTGVTEVDATGTTGVFTVPVMGLSGSTGYTFEAFATNGIGTSYTPAAGFSTAAANIITAWTFPTTAGAPDNSPAPTFGSGTATTLGMTNNYTNGSGTGNTAGDDVLGTAGTANTAFTENLWRIRGTPNNGWAQAAPQYSQGIELDTSTVGYSNIVFAFDWYSTTQGIRDLQVQYNTGSGWVNYQGPSPTGTFIATSNDYNNAGLSPVNPTIYINLSGVAAANNNPDLGIRLVSAYDSTGTLESVSPSTPYASATSTADNIIPYNNSSGNWRFGNLIFYGNSITTTTTITASPAGAQIPGQPVTITATVTPASGAQFPTGTVTFYDGATRLGTTQIVTQVGSTSVGTASITLSTLSPGVHDDITAQYTPDAAASADGFVPSGSSMSQVVGDPTDNPISYTIDAPQATGVDVSPAAGQSFTGVVSTFSDGTITNPAGFSASVNWGDGTTTSGTVAFVSEINQGNIFGQTVAVYTFSVTGTHTYATAGNYPITVTITDPNNQVATVNPTARVAYAPLQVTAGPAINAVAGTSVNNQTVATFTDPGLVANLTALNISDPTTQFTSTINWGDGTTSAATITYNSGTQVFSVIGSHTYSQTGPYNVAVAVTPLTVAVERIDSSDPMNQNVVGDENLDGLTDSPSADFIDQYVIGAANQSAPLYTTSLPTVAVPGGPEAFTNASYSESEGELTLSTNGQYLITAGYDDTVSAWAPQQTKSDPSVIPRNIARIDGNGNVDTSTNIANAYNGDNIRGAVSSDGMEFWTAGQATDTTDYVHYATYDSTTSTQVTAAPGPKDPQDVEIFNGQLYESNRSTSVAAAGIYQVGTGLSTTPTTQTLFIELPQSLPLDVNNDGATLTAFSFWMADLPTNPNSINGVNVCYVADGEMGIARYDYEGTALGWQFSYYIDQTGVFKDSVYTVNSDGTVTPTASFNTNDPAPFSPNPNADDTKEGGAKGLTGRIVDGQVQLFATSGFGTDYQPHPGGNLFEVTDPETRTIPSNFLDTTDAITTLATNPTTDPSELTGVAFSPTAVVTSSAQVGLASPTIISTASAAVTLGTTAPTLSDSALFANGFGATGDLVFTLSGPNGFSYTQSDPLSGDTTYSASDTLPTTGTVVGTYTWHVTYVGDASNNSASDQGGTGEQTVVSKSNPTISPNAGAPVVVGTNTPLTASATLGGGYFETGTITFTLYNPSNVSVYTDTVNVAGNGSYSTISGTTTGSAVPTTAGTYQWVVSYSGDGNNNTVSTTKGAAPEIAVGAGTAIVGNALYLIGGNTNDNVSITPVGTSSTGSTGIHVQAQLNGANVNTTFTQAFSTIYVVGFNGNDNISLASTLTIATSVSEGNGNDNIQFGAGNDSLTAGNGNDNVQAGNGNNVVVLGAGNDNVQAGYGSDSVTAGNGNDNVQLGTVAPPAGIVAGNDTVTLGNGNDNIQAGNGDNNVTAGNGNDNVQLGNGSNVVVLGNGNDNITTGNGNNNITTGNGNDNVHVGNGNNVIVTGTGNSNVTAGNGDNLIVGGLGHDNIQAGNGNNILIDGSVAQNSAALEQVLNEWISDLALLNHGLTAQQIAALIRPSLTVAQYNKSSANTLNAGTGLDWFWDTYSHDHTNRKSTDLLN